MSDIDFIENRTFDEIRVGDTASMSRTLSEKDIELVACAANDVHPARLAHGMWGGLIGSVLGMELFDPSAVRLPQSLRFTQPVGVGEKVTACVTVTEKRADGCFVVLACRCTNQSGDLVITAEAEVRALQEKRRRRRTGLPEGQEALHSRYNQLINETQGGEALQTAVAHPCTAAALAAVVDAAEARLIAPILVGPQKRIRAAAEEAGRDIASFRLVSADHSHDAAAKAVALVRSGDAKLLMKGSLHTDELMAAVVSATAGLRTERRISHAYVMDVPGYPTPLIITDAAINIAPSLKEKADIIRNAIDLAHVIGMAEPKVAILSAVETVNADLPSTLDAAALCKMADRGQISGGLLDGPLALDNAISEAAAREKGIVSPVAGKAEILIVPNLEAGNMLAKQLTFLGGADAAGVVLGARVPIILTSRADSERTKLASCAIAVLLARAAPKAAPGLPQVDA